MNAGALHFLVFDGVPPLLLNGAAVRGPVDIPCPATLQIGAPRAFITHSGANTTSGRNAESTLRIIHSASPCALQRSDPDTLDVTGRIVYRLPEAAGASPAKPLPSHPDFQSQKTTPSFSGESTMAFSMESLNLQIADKVPIHIEYEVKGKIARGGMGKIYSAEDAELDRLVALKVSAAGDRGRDAQFFREANILAALAHPNIVPIHNLGVDAEGRPFYSMKLIEGRTLQWILKQLAAADPGTALVYQYMSPEQANGMFGGLDERSDIYSLGGVLYAILTLRLPVSGSSLNEVLEKVRNGETTTMALPQGSVTTMDPTRVSAVPEALRAVTHKALARERELRYQNVEAFASDIEAYQNGFATSAETAGILRQLVLLVKRHRIASAFAAASLGGAVVLTRPRRWLLSNERSHHPWLRVRECIGKFHLSRTLRKPWRQARNSRGDGLHVC